MVIRLITAGYGVAGDLKKTIIERTRSLTESKNWYQDRYQTMLVQRNILFFLSILSLVVLFFAAAALATLINKKTFEPFVIAVEENTGAVTNVDQQSMQKISAMDSVAKYFIVQYIVARESYSPYLNNQNLKFISAYSTIPTLNKYQADQNKNIEEIRSFASRGITRTVNVGNIFTRESDKDLGDLKEVKFTVSEFLKGNAVKNYHYVLLLRYKFYPEETRSEELAYINPLNFRVLEYQRQEDQTFEEKEK